MGKRLGLRQWIALKLFKKLHKIRTEEHTLNTLFWECTLRCNLQCRHCGSDCKVDTTLKHFAVHSGPEWARHTDNITNVEPRDLFETYLPAFQAAVQKGDVREVMCAYSAYEGEPCCSSDRLLIDILRNRWGFDGLVVTDWGALEIPSATTPLSAAKTSR